MQKGTYTPLLDETIRNCVAVLPWWKGVKQAGGAAAAADVESGGDDDDEIGGDDDGGLDRRRRQRRRLLSLAMAWLSGDWAERV